MVNSIKISLDVGIWKPIKVVANSIRVTKLQGNQILYRYDRESVPSMLLDSMDFEQEIEICSVSDIGLVRVDAYTVSTSNQQGTIEIESEPKEEVPNNLSSKVIANTDSIDRIKKDIVEINRGLVDTTDKILVNSNDIRTNKNNLNSLTTRVEFINGLVDNITSTLEELDLENTLLTQEQLEMVRLMKPTVYLLNRENHFGKQSIDTITDLSERLLEINNLISTLRRDFENKEEYDDTEIRELINTITTKIENVIESKLGSLEVDVNDLKERLDDLNLSDYVKAESLKTTQDNVTYVSQTLVTLQGTVNNNKSEQDDRLRTLESSVDILEGRVNSNGNIVNSVNTELDSIKHRVHTLENKPNNNQLLDSYITIINQTKTRTDIIENMVGNIKKYDSLNSNSAFTRVNISNWSDDIIEKLRTLENSRRTTAGQARDWVNDLRDRLDPQITTAINNSRDAKDEARDAYRKASLNETRIMGDGETNHGIMGTLETYRIQINQLLKDVYNLTNSNSSSNANTVDLTEVNEAIDTLKNRLNEFSGDDEDKKTIEETYTYILSKIEEVRNSIPTADDSLLVKVNKLVADFEEFKNNPNNGNNTTNPTVSLEGTGYLVTPKLDTEQLTEYRNPIDNKPIYNKLIYIGFLPNDTVKITNIIKPNDATYVYIDTNKSFLYREDTKEFLSFDKFKESGISYSLEVNEDIIFTIITNNDKSDYNGYIVLNYTKSTDNVNTPVLVVGRDGEPGQSLFDIWKEQNDSDDINTFLEYARLKNNVPSSVVTFDDLTTEQRNSIKGQKGDSIRINKTFKSIEEANAYIEGDSNNLNDGDIVFIGESITEVARNHIHFYVSPTGSDTTGDGTRENPFYSLKKVPSGCIIGLLPGIYSDTQYGIQSAGVSTRGVHGFFHQKFTEFTGTFPTNIELPKILSQFGTNWKDVEGATDFTYIVPADGKGTVTFKLNSTTYRDYPFHNSYPSSFNSFNRVCYMDLIIEGSRNKTLDYSSSWTIGDATNVLYSNCDFRETGTYSLTYGYKGTGTSSANNDVVLYLNCNFSGKRVNSYNGMSTVTSSNKLRKHLDIYNYRKHIIENSKTFIYHQSDRSLLPITALNITLEEIIEPYEDIVLTNENEFSSEGISLYIPNFDIEKEYNILLEHSYLIDKVEETKIPLDSRIIKLKVNTGIILVKGLNPSSVYDCKVTIRVKDK